MPFLTASNLSTAPFFMFFDYYFRGLSAWRPGLIPNTNLAKSIMRACGVSMLLGGGDCMTLASNHSDSDLCGILTPLPQPPSSIRFRIAYQLQ
jgi:hypothetical protein